MVSLFYSSISNTESTYLVVWLLVLHEGEQLLLLSGQAMSQVRQVMSATLKEVLVHSLLELVGLGAEVVLLNSPVLPEDLLTSLMNELVGYLIGHLHRLDVEEESGSEAESQDDSAQVRVPTNTVEEGEDEVLVNAILFGQEVDITLQGDDLIVRVLEEEVLDIIGTRDALLCPEVLEELFVDDHGLGD